VRDAGSAIALDIESLEEKSTLIVKASRLDYQEAEKAGLVDAH
jgi:hypothetical protein